MAEKKVEWRCGERVVPLAVVTAIAKKFTPNMELFEKTMRDLQWDGLNGCYYFWYANMFHGVEDDGHIHT